MKPGALVIFTKTIGLSPVKTRLAASTGTSFAEEFYALSQSAVNEVALTFKAELKRELSLYRAVAEEAAYADAIKDTPFKEGRREKDFTTLWTGSGGLGERLHSVYSRVLKEHDYVVIIGTDSPLLGSGLLKEALSTLSAATCSTGTAVIGPCPDGGFYLFAAKVPIPESVWTCVTYSTDTTLKELADCLERSAIGVSLISELGDVDTVEDLNLLVHGLGKSKVLLPKQEALYRWLLKHKSRFAP